MYLIKQGNAWSVKVAIPKDVRHVFGKVAFKQALKTSDKIVANARAAPLVIKFQKTNRRGKENPNLSISETLTEAKKRLQELRFKINTASESPAQAHKLADLKETQNAIEGVVSDAILAAKGVMDSGELTEQDRRAVSETYKVITGQLVPTLDNLEPFLKVQAVEPNTSLRYHQMIHRFSEKHPVGSKSLIRN